MCEALCLIPVQGKKKSEKAVSGTCPHAGEPTGWPRLAACTKSIQCPLPEQIPQNAILCRLPLNFLLKKEYKLHHYHLSKNNEKETSSSEVIFILCHKH
jgi:hypothetical protein